MRISALIDGLQIIMKAEPDANVDAQHDQIYVGAYDPDKMSEEDRAKLDATGWFESEHSWSHFT